MQHFARTQLLCICNYSAEPVAISVIGNIRQRPRSYSFVIVKRKQSFSARYIEKIRHLSGEDSKAMGRFFGCF